MPEENLDGSRNLLKAKATLGNSGRTFRFQRRNAYNVISAPMKRTAKRGWCDAKLRAGAQAVLAIEPIRDPPRVSSTNNGRENRASQGENNEETACRHLPGLPDREFRPGWRRGHHPLRAAESRPAHAGTEGICRPDRRAAAQRQIRQSALSGLYPQSRTGAKTVG